MRTWIYKGNLKPQTYLYITVRDDFAQVPKALLNLLGELSYVIDIELDDKRRLAQARIDDVRQQLQAEGFYLQMPPGDQKPEKLC